MCLVDFCFNIRLDFPVWPPVGINIGAEKCHGKVHPTDSDQGRIWPTVAWSLYVEENTEEK